MPMGGKLGETSSGTIPTPMLHGISTSFRTSKSKGTKNIFFQYYCSVEPTSFCMWFLYVTSSLESEVFINKTVWQFHKSSVFCRSVHSLCCVPAQTIIGCWLLYERGGALCDISLCHDVTSSGGDNIKQQQREPPPDSDSEICIIHTAGDGETFLLRDYTKWNCSLTQQWMDERNWYIIYFHFWERNELVPSNLLQIFV